MSARKVIDYVRLSELRNYENNPRQITDSKLRSLVNSILTFPSMQEVRPLAIDSEYRILGGNQRFHALRWIERHFDESIGIIRSCHLSESEREDLISYWELWKKNPVAVVTKTDWSESRQREFVIKDNLNFGEWDYDLLANNFDNDEIVEWGMTLPFDLDKDIDFGNLYEEDRSEKKPKKATEEEDGRSTIYVDLDEADKSAAIELIANILKDNEIECSIE